jgi:hypothetical protein
VHEARHRRLRPAARLAGCGDRRGRGAVIGAIARQDFLPPGDGASNLEGVLIRVRAAVGEEEHIQIARCELRELGAEARARLGRHRRSCVLENGGLLLNRFHHALVGMADVHGHELTVEIDEALAFRRPEVDALRPRDRYRIDRPLRRPFEDRVFLRQRNNLFTRHRVGNSCHLVLRLRNDPDPALPVKRPPSTITRPREITVSVAPVTSRPSYGL